MRSLTVTLLLLCLAAPVVGQSLSFEEGRPFYVERFSPEDYGQHAQNWNVVQDDRGRIFVANRTAVLEFDGENWRSHTIPNRFARSLTFTPGGAVCVGGVGEIGCLRPDSLGSLAYESLLPHIPNEQRTFADVWSAHAVGEAVYFQTFSTVFRWDGRRITTWPAVGRFHKAFVVRDRYFVRDEGAGLFELLDDELVLVPGGERFSEERIDAMLPAGEADILLVTRNRGLLRWNGADISRQTSDLDALLSQERIYHGIALSDSTFALGTVGGQAIIGHVNGSLVSILGLNVGLAPDELVLDLFQDREGGLWLALDTGIMRIDAPSALTLFDGSQGLEGFINHIVRHYGKIYVATSQGLYQLDPSRASHEAARFVRATELRQQIWSVLAVGEVILAAGNDGLYEIVNGEHSEIVPERTFAMHRSAVNQDRVYIGLKEGLGILLRDEVGWRLDRVIGKDQIGEVRSIYEHPDGDLWVGTLAEGIFHVQVHEDNTAVVENVGQELGIPSGPVAMHHQGDGNPLILRDDGIYSSAAGGTLRYERDSRFDGIIDFGSDGGYLLSTPRGRLWVVTDGRLRAYEEESGAFVDATPRPLRLEGIPDRSLYVEANGVVWVAVERGLLRYDPGIEKNYEAPYHALVRRVAKNGQGRLIFGGQGGDEFTAPVIRFSENNLRFEVAAAAFNAPEATRFQYWLEGFEGGWSDWSRERFKEYTNLSEGRYHFHVRARNVNGVLSTVDTFSFTVLPPWYRTWWAYLFYGLAGIAVIWGYSRWRLHEHLGEIERERRVREELQVANARLLEANERLHEADKLKDDLLANTSHELRTPLTAILGFSSVLCEELNDDRREFAEHIQKSGHRLLRTVDSLLDMARLQADTMDIEPEHMDVGAAVREIVVALQPEASEKNLFLKVLPEDMAIPSRTDRAALESILLNLIGNAVKFTDEGGVTVLVDADEEKVYITVRDSGIGITEEFLPQLFVPFRQASGGYGRTYEGTGIGLAITNRLVKLLEGEITVDSQFGHGTAFHVTIPRYASDDNDEQSLGVDGKHLSGRRALVIVGPDRPQHALRSILRSLVYVDVAEGLDAGLDRLSEEDYDIVIVDGNLKGVTIRDVLARVRASEGAREAAVIAATSPALPGERERLLEQGFDAFLGSPFSRSRVVLVLDPLMGRELVA